MEEAEKAEEAEKEKKRKERKEKKKKEKEEDEAEEKEDADGKKKVDISKLDIDKPIVVQPKAELPTHISSLQKIAAQVHRGDFDINDTAEEVELKQLGLQGGNIGLQGGLGPYGVPGAQLRPGVGLGYGAGLPQIRGPIRQGPAIRGGVPSYGIVYGQNILWKYQIILNR